MNKQTKEEAMNEQATIPAPMLDAASKALTYNFECEEWDTGNDELRCVMADRLAQAALEAAGVAALVQRVAELEAALLFVGAKIENGDIVVTMPTFNRWLKSELGRKNND